MDTSKYPQNQTLSANQWAENMRRVLARIGKAESELRSARREIEIMLMQFAVNPEGATEVK